MAKRRFGQHFLIDRRAPGRIVRALGIREGDAVLEIGPGRGALTAPLIRAAGRILAVEVDRELAAGLRKRFDESRLQLVVADFLRLDLGELLAASGFADDRWIVTGNLPYYISKPIVQRLLRQRERVERAVLMFQREVALRLTAKPGGRSFGPLSVLVALGYEVEPLFDLPPNAFAPPPKVESTVTRWKRRDEGALDPEREQRLRHVLAVCFARRRRTLRNNLKSALLEQGLVDELLARTRLDGARRAESLAPADFLRLVEHYPRDAD